MTEGIKHIVAVASGKGGVGKSTVTANLALAMAAEGYRVGLLDADIYGPSQARMLGLPENTRPEVVDEKNMKPVVAHGIQAMSMAFMVDINQPMVWRGPMVSGAFQQLLNQTLWDDLDFLFIDMPPGTGDIQLTLFLVQPTRNAAAGFDIAFTDTSRFAAAASANGGSGDNGNALKLLDLQNQKQVGGQATFSGAYAALVSDVGNQSAIINANLTTQQGLADQLYSYQQADSGVNLDEEYANLLRYQQYYTANSKIIDAGTSVLDTILGLRS